jgi:hypothetical protein
MNQNEIFKMKRRGEFFKVELYRAIKNVLTNGLKDDIYTFDVLPEVESENERKIDLVIFKVSEYYSRKTYFPLIVIETKENKLDEPRESYVGEILEGVRQAREYREVLQAQYYSVYDGLYFLIFDVNFPYLRGILEVKIEDLQQKDLGENFAKGLILSLVKGNPEFENFRRQYLPNQSQLPERILKSLVSEFSTHNDMNFLFQEWKKLLFKDQ